MLVFHRSRHDDGFAGCRHWYETLKLIRYPSLCGWHMMRHSRSLDPSICDCVRSGYFVLEEVYEHTADQNLKGPLDSKEGTERRPKFQS